MEVILQVQQLPVIQAVAEVADQENLMHLKMVTLVAAEDLVLL
jgi:hypothetical protein